MKTFGKFLAVLLGLMLGACSDEAFKGKQDIEIVKAGGETVGFKVKIARLPEELSYGLMFYKHMPERHGMLFDFASERAVRMWMKNTFLALDMLFFTADGKLVYIEKNAVPQTLDPRGPGNISVRYVLEINAGEAAGLGLSIGDKLATDKLS